MLRHESGLPFFGETINTKDLLAENIKRNSVGELIERQELVSACSTLHVSLIRHIFMLMHTSLAENRSF